MALLQISSKPSSIWGFEIPQQKAISQPDLRRTLEESGRGTPPYIYGGGSTVQSITTTPKPAPAGVPTLAFRGVVGAVALK